MYTSLSLVYLAVALTFSSCTAHRKGWWNSPRRPAINLKRPVDPCEGDPCEGVECLNGGQCVGDGVCECVAGYSGPTCNIDPCEGVECLNGGQCVGDGVCECAAGYSGPTCNMRVCNMDECSSTGGACFLYRCVTFGSDCESESKQCDGENGEICLDDNCVIEDDICRRVIDGRFNNCVGQGEQCGEGFCQFQTQCVNNTCRAECGGHGGSGGIECNVFGLGGTCIDGVCLVPCTDDGDCSGSPCIGGFCAVTKCGESSCVQMGGL